MAIMARPQIEDVFYSPKLYIETFLWITTASDGLRPFIFNDLQDAYYDLLIENYWENYRDHNGHMRGRFKGVREVNLKARQFGLSTMFCGLFYHDTLTNPSTNTAIYCHRKEDSEAMLEKYKIFYENMDEEFKPIKDKFNDAELSFPGLYSSVSAHTPAGSKRAQRSAGRSRTVRNYHCSEFAEWPNPRLSMKGMLGAIPQDGMIFIESSANLIGDYFHILYEQGKTQESIWNSRFWPWYDIQKYYHELSPAEARAVEVTLTETEKRLMKIYGLTLSQISWRRFKISEVGGDEQDFLKDFPEDDETCFESGAALVFPKPCRKQLIPLDPALSSDLDGVAVARKAIPGHIHVIGVDVALGIPGGDNSAIVVIDAVTREQVYEWHGHIDPEHLIDMVYEVWLQYPGVVGIESNSIGNTPVTFARRYQDKEPWASNYDTRFQRFLFHNNKTSGGWHTNHGNKGSMIFLMKSMLIQAAQGNPGVKLSSKFLVRELGWFQHLPGGGMGAPGGADEEGSDKLTDDTVMACAIAISLMDFVAKFAEPFALRFMNDTPEFEQLEDSEIWVPASQVIRVRK